MKRIKVFCTLFLLPLFAMSQSVYEQAFEDPGAFHFTQERFGIIADGQHDVSEALQRAINELKNAQNFGVLFVPEGKYLISRTIYVPKAIRIIGYGENRPEFILKEHAEGFQEAPNYMFWFTSGIVENAGKPEDANAGTFYSAISNVDFRIRSGNPQAIAVRSHFAQHSFISHCNFYLGDAFAGIYDLGNEIEGLKFYGGDYGIFSNRTSPGWPMMMLDLYFEGQRSAAVLSRNTGMTMVGVHVKHTPIAIELEEGVADRLYMEDCLFESVKTGVSIGAENQSGSQVNLINIGCRNVPEAVFFASSRKTVPGKGIEYQIKEFVHGLTMDSMADASKYTTEVEIERSSSVPEGLAKNIPSLASMQSWVSVKDFGAIGDGKTDDTQAIKEAIASNEFVYFPTGWYRVTETVELREATQLIGMHPFATQIVIHDNEPVFSGFGAPAAVVQSSKGGANVVNGIGINTGANNYRAVALKWMGSEHSLVNDLKVVGEHGTMVRPGEKVERWWRKSKAYSTQSAPAYELGKDLAWDRQNWSIWITDGGGGIFKDIWTASSFAGAGMYVSHTSTPGRVYAMSIEHHVRQEVRLKNVSGWKFYAFQFEEEGREGKKANTLNISDCEDLMFANVWMYRTIRVNTPRHWGVMVSNCRDIEFRNMRSWTQVLQLPGITVYDMNKQLFVYPGDFAKVLLTGLEQANQRPGLSAQIEKLGSGYEYATGAVADSRGNVYFCDHAMKRVYKYSAESDSISIYTDFPYKPLSLAVDTLDNLLVVSRYDPQKGFEDGALPGVIETLPDNNRLYSGWGNGGWSVAVYAVDPLKSDDFLPLKLVQTEQLEGIERVIHPSHRWREDFAEVVQDLAQTSFVAPDGVTIIPNTFDLCRSVQLFAVKPGQQTPVYVTHEDSKVTYRFKVAEDGRLHEMDPFISRGEYANVRDKVGRVYLAEGEIIELDDHGEEKERIQLDERVQSMTLGGQEAEDLFVTTNTALFRIKR